LNSVVACSGLSPADAHTAWTRAFDAVAEAAPDMGVTEYWFLLVEERRAKTRYFEACGGDSPDQAMRYQEDDLIGRTYSLTPFDL
jgi:hypothetical protein